MKRFTRALVSAAVMGAGVLAPMGTATAAVASAPARQDGRNAALYYWRAFYTLDRDFQRQVGEILPGERAADWRPPSEIVQKLTENSSFINELLVATRIDKCDFGIAYEEGFMALLPHLGIMRSSTRILVMDARRLMDAGDWDGAAERIAAMYRMAVHLKNDDVLISALVAAAITAQANTEVTAIVAGEHLSPAGRDVILGALQPLNQADGLGIKRCIEMERNMTIDYMRRTLKGPQAGKKLAEIGLGIGEKELSEQISALDEAGVSAELNKIPPYYVGILGAWDDADYQTKFRTLEDRLTKGDFGLIARLVVPSVGKAKISSVKAADDLRQSIHRLQTAKTVDPAAQPAAPTK
jgi:hypothetical protein